ncbi:bifunctional riboflavin kinase/FAD synthetase [bacterium]|nr:bifunctional riboflavin kinase/FAD synthetase [candidate division CSSED10-310 bacterium]
MKCIKAIEKFPRGLPNTVLTMGNFDGLHIGHQKLIHRVIDESKALDGTSVLLTFQPHPSYVVHNVQRIKKITSFNEMLELLRQYGLEYLLAIPFTPEFATIEPETFLSDIIKKYINPAAIAVGVDHRFGRDRKGDISCLQRFCDRESIRLHIVDQVFKLGDVVSSTRIRKAVDQANLDLVTSLLGRFLKTSGVITKGVGRGAELGFPTANIHSGDHILPPSGVYATRSLLKHIYHPSVTYIGNSPTFNGKDLLVETHIFGIHQSLYGETLTVEFLKYIRPEKIFKNTFDLIKQMQTDMKRAMEMYGCFFSEKE